MSKPEDFAREIQGALMTFANQCETEMSKAADKVAKKAVKKLKQTSPEGTGEWKGHYKDGWMTKKLDGKRVIANKKYQLTHLLEYGHDVIFKGKNKGKAPAQPHIKPVEEWVQDEFEDEIIKVIEGKL